jgi:hypothetical protein
MTYNYTVLMVKTILCYMYLIWGHGLGGGGGKRRGKRRGKEGEGGGGRRRGKERGEGGGRRAWGHGPPNNCTQYFLFDHPT